MIPRGNKIHNPLNGQTQATTISALVVGAVAMIGMVTGGVGCSLAEEGMGMEGDSGGWVVLDTPFGKMRVAVTVTAEGGTQ